MILLHHYAPGDDFDMLDMRESTTAHRAHLEMSATKIKVNSIKCD